MLQPEAEVIVLRGMRPLLLNDMVPRGYKFIGYSRPTKDDPGGRKQYREFYEDGGNWYSWVFTMIEHPVHGTVDAGSVYGPISVL